MKIPENKRYEHQTLFYYYYKDLNGNWTRCKRFSLSDFLRKGYGNGEMAEYEAKKARKEFDKKGYPKDRDFEFRKKLTIVFISLFVIIYVIGVCFVVYIFSDFLIKKIFNNAFLLCISSLFLI